MTKLVIIDAHAMLHRAFHAMPRLTTKDGKPIGAVQGFVNILIKIVNDLKPNSLVVCFDRKEKTFRKKAFANYQAHRPETDSELASQFNEARKVLTAMHIEVFDKKGYEADDLIGTIAKQATEIKKTPYEVIIVTGDKDQLQLVNNRVKVFMPGRSIAQARFFGEKEVFDLLGVFPNRVVDLKALMGDSSDNYPGIYGIGPKAAEKLINEFGSFENIYRNLSKVQEKTKQKLVKGKKAGQMSYQLAKIVTDLDLKLDFKKFTNWNLGSKEVLVLFEEYGFRSLPRRIGSLSSTKPVSTVFKKNLKMDDIEKVVVQLSAKLKGKVYAIRGTASLVLQGVDMVVDDIDVICDKDSALFLNTAFDDKVIEKVKHSESSNFKSYFGRFNFEEVLVEVMGELEILNTNKRKIKEVKWTGAGNQAGNINVAGKQVRVTTIESELAMYAAMGRWNAFRKLKMQQTKTNQQSLF